MAQVNSSRSVGFLALATVAVAALWAPSAHAENPGFSSRDQANAGAGHASLCGSACLAQQALSTAIQDPLRLGNSRLQLRVGSTKLTIGWSVAF